MGTQQSTVRKCKNIRDRIYSREQLPPAVFKRQVWRLLSPECSLVDIGCGREAVFLRELSRFVQIAYGVDPEIPETSVEGDIQVIPGSAEALPLRDRSIDIITMVNVAEHLPDPKRAFQECRRVLKPGGSLILTTPSAFHLPIMVGRLLPHRIRQWANAAITGTKYEDTFPAYYRANTARALRRLASLSGLSIVRIEYLSNHPQYFMFSTCAYRCAVAFERHVLQRELFSCFRQQIVCQLIRPSRAEPE